LRDISPYSKSSLKNYSRKRIYLKQIKKEKIQFDNTSYIDPRGRVFYHQGGIYRAFYPEVSTFYQELLLSQAIRNFIEKGNLIDTTIEPELQIEGFSLIVNHRRIPFPSYCFEWPMAMLKEAALLTLDISLGMIDSNIILQDASPYNIFFDFTKPVFIDLGSFVPSYSDYLWAPYQQFCTFFLFPLYVYSSGISDLPRKLLQDCSHGVSAQNVARILRLKDKFTSRGYISRIFIPELITLLFKKVYDREKITSLSSRLGKHIEMQKLRKKFFLSLRRDVERIKDIDSMSDWSDYYSKTNEKVLVEKKRIIENIFNELRPATVLDIGCNTGVFSLMAERSGALVVAVDIDHDCVNRLYRLAVKEDLKILPIVMNILDPSPGIGWRGIQYSSAQERFKCEMVLAQALLHHLIFTGGQDFHRSIQSIKDFQLDSLVIEYVDINDPMAKLLPRRPTIDYSWYTLDSFVEALSLHYKEVKILKKLSNTRILFHCR
jgi:SAM-dependent methyltransferase